MKKVALPSILGILALYSALTWLVACAGGGGGGGGDELPRTNGISIIGISAGYGISAAITSDGARWVWGYNRDYQLGTGYNEPQTPNVPIRILDEAGGDCNWDLISAGTSHMMGIQYDAFDGMYTLWGWGTNYGGAIGTGGFDVRRPDRIDSDKDWEQVSCGDSHTIGLKRDGTIWTWGSDDYGQLGRNGYPSDAQVYIGEDAGDNDDWAIVCAGEYHTLAISDSGELYAWGRNFYGQLGLGDKVDRELPVKVDVGGKAVKSVAAGGNHTVAIAVDGSLWHWGKDRPSAQGAILRPESFGPSGDRWVKASAGYDYTLAIRDDGTLWAWGVNASGAMGVGEGVETHDGGAYLVLQVMPEFGWVDVDAGVYHSLGIRSSPPSGDRDLYAWGESSHGELGTGDYEDRYEPRMITLVGTGTIP